MPGGRKKSSKTPDRGDCHGPPELTPQSSRPSDSLYGTSEDDFERFVRETLVEIRDAQRTLSQRIDRLEANSNESIEFESKRISDLERKTTDLEKLAEKVLQTQDALSQHAEQLNKLERFSRRNNIRIIGMPQEKNEDCLALTKKMLETKFDLHDVKLERAHRDGPKMQGKPQHLLVKLNNSYQDKVAIMKKHRQALADVPYFCVEDLTRHDLREKRKWAIQASQSYREGKRYRFVAGKWRDQGGSLADFYQG